MLDLSSRPLTARNIEDFRACPAKFLLSVTASREEIDRLLGGPAMLTKAVRAALQDTIVQALGRDYAAQGPSDPTLTPAHGAIVLDEKALIAAYESRFDGRLCADSREEDDLYAQGRRFLCAYAERLRAEGLPSSPLMAEDSAQIGSEAASPAVCVAVMLEESLDGQAFLAPADVEIVRGEERVLVRYTLARKAPPPKELGQDPSVVLLHELALQHYGGESPAIVLESLRHGRAIRPDFGDERLEATREQILQVSRRLRATEEFIPVKSNRCRWCRSRRRCPAWER